MTTPSHTGLLRSFLFVPADNDRLLASAVGKPADVVILDLEDGTAPSRREAAESPDHIIPGHDPVTCSLYPRSGRDDLEIHALA